MPERFRLVYGEEAKSFNDSQSLISEHEDKYYLIDSDTNDIVFADGSYESPEDNNLGRHFGRLVELLNDVDNQRLAERALSC